MGLKGKLSCQTGIKSEGDVFHEIVSSRPHHIHTMSPDNIHGCELHEGEFGQVGSVIIHKYFKDGKVMVAKQKVEVIDEENKLVRVNMIEGDLMESFKMFTSSIHVDTKGEDNLVTWTIEYEKLNETVEDPTSYLNLALRVIRDIEAYHLPK